MKFWHKLIKVLFIAGTCVVTGCESKKKSDMAYPVLPGYNLSNPVIVSLKSEMDEISGLQYYAKDTSVFAINDETGFLYKVHLNKKVGIEKWKFSKKADYEDLFLMDSIFYALKSDGEINAFKFFSSDSLVKNDYSPHFEGKNEFESLYFDSNQKMLVLLCKDCEADKKKSLTAYSFNPATNSFGKEPFYTLDVNKIADKLGLDKMKFKPSATAIHPLTKELYIISAINKAVVVVGMDGKVKEAYPIDPVLFKQPEGITFTPRGDLLISNEAAEVGSANILIFKYNAKNVQ